MAPRAEQLRRLAVDRGVLGSSRTWALVAVGIYGIRLLRWMARRDTEVVGVEDLHLLVAVAVHEHHDVAVARLAPGAGHEGRG